MRYALLLLPTALLLSSVEGPKYHDTNFAESYLLSNMSVIEVDHELTQRPKPYDSFGAISSNDEKARLDNFAIELQSDPNAIGYIIVYGRRSRPGEAKKRADRAKRYLWYNRNIETKRVESLDHCFRVRLEVELWIVRQGGKVPVPCQVKVKRR